MGWDSLISDRAATAFATTWGKKRGELRVSRASGAWQGLIQGWVHTGSKVELYQLPHHLSEPSGMQHNLRTNLQSPKLHWEERGHHKRPCWGSSWRWHPRGTPPPCRLHILPNSQGMLSSTAKMPKPPAALFIQECVPLTQFPHGTWLNSDPEMSWQVPGSLQLSAAALAGHTVGEQTNDFPKMGNSC